MRYGYSRLGDHQIELWKDNQPTGCKFTWDLERGENFLRFFDDQAEVFEPGILEVLQEITEELRYEAVRDRAASRISDFFGG